MLTIENLEKKYKENIIFQNVNLAIPKQKITFIAGKNGTGKTTLLKCLLDLESYKGSIKFDNHDIHSVRDDIFVVYDNTPLYENLSGYHNIELLLNKILPKKHMHNVSETLLKPNILKSKVKSYSYGQRKKLSLIIAILAEPKYLFLDEVSNGLDYESLIELKKWLLQYSSMITIIAIGHQFEFYADLIDSLIIMNDQTAIQINDFKQSGVDLIATYKQYVE